MVGAKVLTTNIFEDYTYFWMQPPLPPERVGLGTGEARGKSRDSELSHFMATGFLFCRVPLLMLSPLPS